jgi:hypothetical protein
MQGEFMPTVDEIPVRGIGIIDLVGELDLDSFGQQIRHLVKFVESAMFGNNSFCTAEVVS